MFIRQLPVMLLLLGMMMVAGACSRPPPPREYIVEKPSPPVYKPYREPVFSEKPVSKPSPPPVLTLRRGLIVLDAGHGGKDQGAISPFKPNYMEKSLTLVTTRLVKGYLEQMGYQIYMVRNADIAVPLKERAVIANKQKPLIFVSLHFNSAQNEEAEGIEVFYYKSEDNKGRTMSSKALAQSVLNKVLVETEAKSRGVKHGNLAVVRETNMPSILVEGGFLTNPSEMGKIKDPAYLKKLAWGVTQGIDNYLQKK